MVTRQGRLRGGGGLRGAGTGGGEDGDGAAEDSPDGKGPHVEALLEGGSLVLVSWSCASLNGDVPPSVACTLEREGRERHRE